MSNAEGKFVKCPCCNGPLFLRKRRVDEHKCHKCGALIEITITVRQIEPGDIKVAAPPARKYRRKEDR